MDGIILGSIGAAAAVFSGIMLIKHILFMVKSNKTTGRVVSARKDAKGWYIPKMRFEAEGNEITAESGEHYSSPLTGEERELRYKRNDPEKIMMTESLRNNIMGYSAGVIIGLLFVLKFWVLGVGM